MKPNHHTIKQNRPRQETFPSRFIRSILILVFSITSQSGRAAELSHRRPRPGGIPTFPVLIVFNFHTISSPAFTGPKSSPSEPRPATGRTRCPPILVITGFLRKWSRRRTVTLSAVAWRGLLALASIVFFNSSSHCVTVQSQGLNRPRQGSLSAMVHAKFLYSCI